METRKKRLPGYQIDIIKKRPVTYRLPKRLPLAGNTLRVYINFFVFLLRVYINFFVFLLRVYINFFVFWLLKVSGSDFMYTNLG